MSSSIGITIARNSLFNVVRSLITVPIMLIMTPFVFSSLGAEKFGIWALVGVMSSYVQLGDLGLAEGVVRHIAEYHVRDDRKKLNEIINTALVLYAVIGVAVGIIIVVLLPAVIIRFLHIASPMATEAIFVFSLAALVMLVNMLFSVFGSVVIGMQRMDYANGVGVLAAVASALGTYYVLQRGLGLSGLVYNNALVALLVAAANIAAAKRLFGPLSVRPLQFCRWSTMKELFHFSWKIHVTNVTQLFIFQFDRLLLSHYLGLSAVSHYELANRVPFSARGLIVSVFYPMMPAASALHASNETALIRDLYHRSVKYLAMIVVPFSLFIIAVAGPFMRLWMGPGFDVSAVTMQILVFMYMLNLLTGPGSFIINAMNMPQISMYTSIAAGLMNVLLSTMLVRNIGYYGVLIGMLISFVVTGGYFLVLIHRIIGGLRWEIYKDSLFLPLFYSTILGVMLAGLDHLWPVQSIWTIGLFGVVYAILVYVLLYVSNYFDPLDKELLYNVLH